MLLYVKGGAAVVRDKYRVFHFASGLTIDNGNPGAHDAGLSADAAPLPREKLEGGQGSARKRRARRGDCRVPRRSVPSLVFLALDDRGHRPAD